MRKKCIKKWHARIKLTRNIDQLGTTEWTVLENTSRLVTTTATQWSPIYLLINLSPVVQIKIIMLFDIFTLTTTSGQYSN